ncbi:MAG TPA: alpha/beta hydrolase [Jatrophihabitans sp.]|jgi:pimeloyl-ACP methyl ester carboxylesterase|uniref:alpha/beta fold hydrolase n=1 Tax=Jatrophihabitans sp. TaxID=1932789 RepID=UPI002DF9D071|nr:alpha/beta hydrolase [Jatrophihabitans sp.]
MPSFAAPDRTELAYTEIGRGSPVICLPGGPMQDSAYLGDLGGLSSAVRLIRLDLRGTGSSQQPTDPQSYRCDRQVDDVEALRAHLGLERVSVLGHSAGANLALQYAARFPDRVERLVLITPSTFGVGLPAGSEQRRAMVRLRRDETWYPEAAAAFERVQTGDARDADWHALTPFTYGRWDAAARAHDAAVVGHDEAADVFREGFDPPALRAGLSGVTAPALVLAGAVDIAGPPEVLAELAALLPNGSLVVQPAAGHFPWLDDRDTFVSTVAGFLS